RCRTDVLGVGVCEEAEDLTNRNADTILWTIAHEIGHVLGLSHSTDRDSLYGGDNLNFNQYSDYESRLMTDRSGPKSDSHPKRLLKGEWDTIRFFGTVQKIFLKDTP
ncbi:MAG: hypothetical protein B7Z37_23025, partial [Verrucomicrobia bacterium 12-59-8]